ncbi:MAG: Crossover junction endodeoxyribonuclease RuvC [candidate division WWE3 bacterium GW2011_GWC1_41_7]|uniref:Crossover junction endodeoxyribonuclease RuvC n=4 Tax=Katanobacteria TaxID=422282 RepID=A0A0G0X867_UNCKA|nr:MAG: Crossover junction endodeoxyribonuclease RuvC [candidate division WWE3 bacterium GW2011_GWB1_41_6]KKS21239.1 MAG: Crossover junction endodeoxyribonuclease RuvC [candidate division WWE3 bacterium GW2011_GWA1_41_8]KKS21391.1 MAG: Crossover junction endodeoxyribonuclease RuvC [candidate division WWE3 bacterium GW2011_GWC1_41_7]OGC56397.1 MAG: crossover junction endodeoxyribonuclease RuvC [candidate division WWE3 bacterium RIFCSPLOWO2_01_FULL_41_9]
MLILGIDPGTARTGYAIVQLSSEPKLIETSTIVTPPELEMHKRLKMLYRELNGIVKKHSPDVMVVERLFFNTNVKTAIAVGQSRGISLLVAANKNIMVTEYTALEAKCALTGYGRSKKKEMQEAVKNILKLESVVKSDDANDAVAMALCYVKKEFAQLLH